MIRAIFIGEGSSDDPLAAIVEALFRRHGAEVEITTPDFDRLPARVSKSVEGKVAASLKLTSTPIDLFVVHRDSDGEDVSHRRAEIQSAVSAAIPNGAFMPVVPIRMTEAWLLLDEAAIRRIAGNPNGRVPLDLPSAREVERRADPKALLSKALLTASNESGRRRERVARRFSEHRRSLLERLDLDGAVTQLDAWQRLLKDVAEVAHRWSAGGPTMNEWPEPPSRDS